MYVLIRMVTGLVSARVKGVGKMRGIVEEMFGGYLGVKGLLREEEIAAVAYCGLLFNCAKVFENIDF